MCKKPIKLFNKLIIEAVVQLAALQTAQVEAAATQSAVTETEQWVAEAQEAWRAAA